MIEAVHLEGVKLLRSVHVRLGRLNMIVGRNAIGKSTFMSALQSIIDISKINHSTQNVYNEIVNSFNNIDQYNIDTKDSTGILFKISLVLSKNLKPSKIIHFSCDNLYRFTIHTQDKSTLDEQNILIQKSATGVTIPSLLHRLTQDITSQYLRLHAADLAADHAADTDIPTMGPTGAGLASVLQYVQGLRDGKLEAIESDLARVVPGARRVRALPVRLQQQERVRVAINGQESWHEQQRTVTGSRFEVEFEGQGWIRAGQLSEGTLLMLGLLTTLRHRAPTLLLLDDLDKGLHPVAQREAVRLLREAMRLNPALQIVATSHSPFVLDGLSADEVFVMGAVGPGESQIRRLDSHPAWERHKEFMHPGEFWSAIGEGWVGEAR